MSDPLNVFAMTISGYTPVWKSGLLIAAIKDIHNAIDRYYSAQKAH
jgi:hypothetical protein